MSSISNNLNSCQALFSRDPRYYFCIVEIIEEIIFLIMAKKAYHHGQPIVFMYVIITVFRFSNSFLVSVNRQITVIGELVTFIIPNKVPIREQQLSIFALYLFRLNVSKLKLKTISNRNNLAERSCI